MAAGATLPWPSPDQAVSQSTRKTRQKALAARFHRIKLHNHTWGVWAFCRTGRVTYF
jgi:hypothetical protein